MSEVTVVVPVFNSEATIQRALDSVAMQTLLPLRVIVVDDCSTDNTLILLKEKKYNFQFDVIKLKNNSGPAVARNVALDHVKTKWVAFLDSDDTWHPSKLELQIRALEQHGADICGHICNRESWLDISYIGIKRISRISCIFKNPYSTPSVILRSSLGYRFNENLRYAEDWNLWCRIIFDGHIALLCSPQLAYVHKPLFGSSGLSSHLFKMEVGELASIFQLFRTGRIGLLLLTSSSFWSIFKFMRRYLFKWI